MFLIFSLFSRFFTNVTDAPHLYIVNASEGDYWELQSDTKRTIYSIHRVGDKSRGFTIVEGSKRTIFDKLDQQNVIQFLKSQSKLIFENMANGSYEVVAMSLNNDCQQGLYVSNLNGMPLETNSFNLQSNDLCFLSHGFPVSDILITGLFPYSGSIYYIESDKKIKKLTPDSKKTEVTLTLTKSNESSPVLMHALGYKFMNTNPYIKDFEYVTNEIREADFPIGFSIDYTGTETSNKTMMFYMLIGLGAVIVVIVAGVIVFVICGPKKKKKKKHEHEHHVQPIEPGHIETDFKITHVPSNYEEPKYQGEKEVEAISSAIMKPPSPSGEPPSPTGEPNTHTVEEMHDEVEDNDEVGRLAEL